MITLITDQANNIVQYIKDDPVRPEIPLIYRVTEPRFIMALVDSDSPLAIVCVSLHDFVPASVQDLDIVASSPTTAVFYTIWSYRPGSGASLLRQGLDTIRTRHSSVDRFVTLSPKTEMARKFHIKNGATVFRENKETINYEYFVN